MSNSQSSENGKSAEGVTGRVCRACHDFQTWMRAKRSKLDSGTQSAESNSATQKSGDTASTSRQVSQGQENDVPSHGAKSEIPEIPARNDCPLDKDKLGSASWGLLHTIGANFPENPDSGTKEDIGRFLTLFAKFYPCDYCAEDLKNSITGWLVNKLIFERRNARLEKLAVNLLDIQPNEHILEIGFGPGIGLQRACDILTAQHSQCPTTSGTVTGIDVSKIMVEKVRKRLSYDIAKGRLNLLRTSVDLMPFMDESFDKVFHCNCYYFWPNIYRSSCEILRVMKPGALMVTTIDLQSIKRASSVGVLNSSKTDPLDYMINLEKAGFESVNIEYLKDQKGVDFQAIFARKPDEIVDKSSQEIDEDMQRLKVRVLSEQQIQLVMRIRRPIVQRKGVPEKRGQ